MQPAIDDIAVKFISIAEDMFGPATCDWEYCGVIFQDIPPHLAYYPEDCKVAISLSLKAIDDEFQRDFQLAHEVCHLLYPTADIKTATVPQTIVINEGISTYFSIIIVSALHGDEAAGMALESLATNSPKYFSAFKKVLGLLNKDQQAIKKIRQIQPKINDLILSDLQAAGLQLTEEEITALISAF